VLGQATLTGALILPVQRVRTISNGGLGNPGSCCELASSAMDHIPNGSRADLQRNAKAHVFRFDSASNDDCISWSNAARHRKGIIVHQHPAVMWLGSRVRRKLM
jgi:hypothetical protein